MEVGMPIYCGSHYSLGWDPGMYKMEWVSWAQAFISDDPWKHCSQWETQTLTAPSQKDSLHCRTHTKKHFTKETDEQRELRRNSSYQHTKPAKLYHLWQRKKITNLIQQSRKQPTWSRISKMFSIITLNITVLGTPNKDADWLLEKKIGSKSLLFLRYILHWQRYLVNSESKWMLKRSWLSNSDNW